MKTKTLRRAAAVLLPLMAAAPAAATEKSLHYNIVNFRESVSVTVANDTLHVTLNITEKAKNRQEAAQTVTRRLNAVIARIKANRAFESETVNRSVHPEYDDKGRVNGWRDSAQVRISSTDFAALLRLVADSEKEASPEHMYYSVSPKKRAAAVEEASTKVLHTFRERAQNLSRSLGFSGYKIVQIDLNSTFERSADAVAYAAPMAASVKMRAAPMAADAAVMDNNPGEQHIRQSISASIQMY